MSLAAIDAQFYEEVRRQYADGKASLVSSDEVPAGTGFGARVPAGHTFRFVMKETAQIIDLDMFSAREPSEHFHAPSQLRLEGGRVGTLTRIWGTPPSTRPLATVIRDEIAHRRPEGILRDHKAYGAHCNPHQWMLFAGFIPRTCYDNLRQGCSMIGLPQQAIHDNLNLYMKSALDPQTGRHLNVKSDAQAGDFIEFFAEIDLLVAFSLCPYGDGSVVPADWATTPVPVSPIDFEVWRTGIQPRDWSW